MGSFNLFKKKPILREPDINNIMQCYFQLHNDVLNGLCKIKDIDDIAYILGRYIHEFAEIDLINLNKLLSGCNIEEINTKKINFITERSAFYVYDFYINILKTCKKDFAIQMTDIIIDSTTLAISFNEKNNRDYDDFVKLIKNRLILSLNDYSEVEENFIYDSCCYKCFNSVGMLNNYFIAKTQFDPIVLASSRGLINFIIPLFVHEYELLAKILQNIPAPSEPSKSNLNPQPQEGTP